MEDKTNDTLKPGYLRKHLLADDAAVSAAKTAIRTFRVVQSAIPLRREEAGPPQFRILGTSTFCDPNWSNDSCQLGHRDFGS